MDYNIPSDPAMLLSFINMKLLDYYPTLEALCDDLDINIDDLCNRLAAIDYHYDPSLNKFN